MAKVFEYKIEVDSTEVDVAKGKVESLEAATESSMQSSATSIRSVGDAAKSTSKDFQTMNTAGKATATGVSKGFKGMGDAAKSFDKVLKANQLFILIAVVIPLIDLFKDLLNRFGLLTIVTEGLNAALDAMVGFFKDLFDWIGLTDYAGEERSKNAREYLEKESEALEELNKKQEALAKSRIALLRSEGEEMEANALEAELLQTTYENNAKRLEQQQKDIVFQMANLKKAIDETVGDRSGIVLAAQREYDLLAIQLEGINADIVKNAADTLKGERDIESKREESRQKGIEAQRKYDAARLSAQRAIEDIGISLIEDSTQQEIAINNTKYDRLIEDVRKNENLLQSERDALIEAYESAREAKQAEIDQRIRDKAIDESLKLTELQLQLDRQRAEASESVTAELIQRESDLKLEKLKEQLERGQLAEEEFALRKVMLEEETAREIAKIDDALLAKKKENIKTEEELTREKNQAIAATTMNVLGAIGANLEEGSELAKGIAAAQATYSTGEAAIAAYKSMVGIPVVGPVLAPIAAAAAAAFGLAQIRQILSTPSSVDNAPSGISGGGTNITAATNTVTGGGINFFGSAGSTSGDVSQFDSVVNEEPKPVRAIVSWNDIDAVSKSDQSIRREMQL